MSRIAYVNGRYVPHFRAMVHIEDRGCQLSDGVYEVMAVRDGAPIDLGPHLERLNRSLREIRIEGPVVRGVLATVMREMVWRNRITEGILYLQITRGVAKREHAFPTMTDRSLVVTARRHKLPTEAALEKGISVISVPDTRWYRCDIKAIGLLPNVLGKQTAKEAGAFEAWMVRENGHVSEGTSSNAWIVTPSGELVTHPAGPAILSGITREAVLEVAATLKLPLVERPFTVAEAQAAAEAFLTSTTNFVMPVIRIDGRPVGSGKPGPITRKLWHGYVARLDRGANSW
ncbi:MAG: D-amino-acid transaminase [Alphaproteobacteria bacterium]